MPPGSKRDAAPFGHENLGKKGRCHEDAPGSETLRRFAELLTFATIVWRQPILGHFFGYFLFGLEKKVTRLPAGTGEVVLFPD
jgi:hypothetical protein